MNFLLKRHLLKDPKVKELYKQHKNADLWACVASVMFGVPYDSCLLYNIDNTPNPSGQTLRTFAKRLVLYTHYPQGGLNRVANLLLTDELSRLIDAVDYEVI